MDFQTRLSARDGPAPKGKLAVAITVLYMVVAVLTAGVIIGYGQLYPMMIDTGVYHSLCPRTNASLSSSCPAQDDALDNMFIIGSAVSIFIQAPAGAMLDFIGPRITSWVGLVILVVGALIFAFSSEQFNGYLASFVMLSGGGPFVFLSTLHVAALFPSKSGLIMALLNGSFSGGALLFLVFNYLYYGGYMSLKMLFVTYAVILCVIFVLTFFLWPWTKFPEKNGPTDIISEFQKYDTFPKKENFEKNPMFGQNGDLTVQNDDDSTYKEKYYKQTEDDSTYWEKLKENALNWHFLFLALYFPLMVSMGNFYLATSDQQTMLVTTDKKTLTQYGHILAIMLPVLGIVASPMGLIIDNFGMNVGILLFVVLSTSAHAIGIIRILPLQILRFVIFSIYYPLTYTLWADFIIKKFGFVNYGVLFGIVAAVAGAFSFATTSLVDFTLNTGQFDWVNIGWIGATTLGLVYPAVITVVECWKVHESR